MKILSFGEIIWDVYENESFIGGAPLNLAAHCSKQGAKSFMLSAVGNDADGKASLKEVEGFNVKTDFVFINNEKETGKCIVTLNEKAKTLQTEYEEFERKLNNNAFATRERAEAEQNRILKKREELEQLKATGVLEE